LTIDFVPVDGPTNFQNTIDESVLFINKTYPLADDGIVYTKAFVPVPTILIPPIPILFEINVLLSVRSASILSGHFTERSVGVVQNGWFADNSLFAPNARGYAFYTFFPAVVIEEGFRHNAAHELGHTYGLCDEYSDSDWEKIHNFPGLSCPNGDINEDNELDDPKKEKLLEVLEKFNTIKESGENAFNLIKRVGSIATKYVPMFFGLIN